MQYYPVYLDIRNRKCLIVGGGSVGTRKVATLLECGASATVVSPAVTNTLHNLAENGDIQLKLRQYQRSDIENMFLVIGATDNEDLNQQIHADAEQAGILCNIADRPKACNFILPSIICRGDLIIAISTSGTSPAFAKKLRKELESRFGEEYAEFLRIMKTIRNRLLSEAHAPEAHKPIFEKIINSDLIEWIRQGNKEKINQFLVQTLGAGFEIPLTPKKGQL